MLNKIILIGRLTRDPELRYTPNGVAVTNFTLAVDRPRANQEGQREADFIDIVTWRNLAELCANYLSKGKLAAVDGRLEIRSYDTPDGQKRRATRVVAENVRFLSPRDNNGDDNQYDNYNDQSGIGPEINFNDDDIPF